MCCNVGEARRQQSSCRQRGGRQLQRWIIWQAVWARTMTSRKRYTQTRLTRATRKKINPSHQSNQRKTQSSSKGRNTGNDKINKKKSKKAHEQRRRATTTTTTTTTTTARQRWSHLSAAALLRALSLSSVCERS